MTNFATVKMNGLLKEVDNYGFDVPPKNRKMANNFINHAGSNLIFMKRILTLGAILGSISLCHGQTFQAILQSGDETTPNTDTSVYGTSAFADFTLSGQTLSVTSAFYGNMPGVPTAITIDDGYAGTDGTTVFSLTVDTANDFAVSDPGQGPGGSTLYDGSFEGSGALTGQQVTDLENGELYVNIQTTVNPTPGEVRGQIAAVPEPGTMALMAVGAVSWLGMRRKKA